MKELNINHHMQNQVLVLTLQGDLDAFTAQKVRQTLDQLCEEGYRQIVLDCSELNYINSTAIGVLVSRMHHLHRLQGELALAALRPRVERILTLVGGRRLFLIFESVSEAVARLAQSNEEPEADSEALFSKSRTLVLN